MITNASLTIFHKELDNETRIEKWTRYNYDKVWMFIKEGVIQNNGFENSNSAEIRIPYNLNPNVNIKNFSKEDVIVGEKIIEDIKSIKELTGKKTYLLMSITNNIYGTEPHIHLRAN